MFSIPPTKKADNTQKDVKPSMTSTAQADLKFFPKPISKNKSNFMNNIAPSYNLAAKDLPAITSHLNKKHNIKIIINGMHPESKSVIEKNQAAIQNEMNSYSKNLRSKEEIDDCCLTEAQAYDEVKHIQNSLKDNEVVGYIFTGNHRIARAHCEVVIITKHSVIRPIIWPQLAAQPGLKNSSYASPIQPNNVCAQGGDIECGTLGILYLKELLKNNCQQLHDFCLQFPYYKMDAKKQDVEFGFFPSPQVLRYSQSKQFNEYLLKMLEDNDTFEVKKKDGTTIVGNSLKKILTDSLGLAKQCNDAKNYLQIQTILKSLPAFKEKWLKEYQVMDGKRSQMNFKNDKNYYLTYRTIKFEKIAENEGKAERVDAPVPLDDTHLIFGKTLVQNL